MPSDKTKSKTEVTENETPVTPSHTRGRQRTIRGVVSSDKMNKTRIIEVNRSLKHALYHKRFYRSDRFFIHDEKNESKAGDLVEARSCRPLSKNKAFRLIKILEKAVIS